MKINTSHSGASGHPPQSPPARSATAAFPLLPPRFRLPASRRRWGLRWGRPLPWPTRMEIIATLVFWLAGAWGWERWGHVLSAPSPVAEWSPAARSIAAAARTALLLTPERPDADGLFAYGQDRLTVRVPVALRQAPRQADRPDLTRARGQEADGLRFELTRVFDPRARHVTRPTLPMTRPPQSAGSRGRRCWTRPMSWWRSPARNRAPFTPWFTPDCPVARD